MSEEEAPLGAKLRLLRQALGWGSLPRFLHESFGVAERLGPGYKPLDRTNFSHIENGRLQLTLDSTRAVVCGVLGITRDELADYLDGKRSLDSVKTAREERARAAASAAGADHVPSPAPSSESPVMYASHPDWPRLVLQAQELDPELGEETFTEIGDTTFLGSAEELHALDATYIAQIARAHQNWRRRAKSKATPG